jgi:hypothetical protein
MPGLSNASEGAFRAAPPASERDWLPVHGGPFCSNLQLNFGPHKIICKTASMPLVARRRRDVPHGMA